MGMCLLRSTEDSRPLVHTTASVPVMSDPSQIIADGYVNKVISEPDITISSKFGDSCRQSLRVFHSKDPTQRLQSHAKKKYLQEKTNADSRLKSYVPHTSFRLGNISLSEASELKGAAWFQAGIPREISLEVLSRQSPGAFLVRQSSTKPGCFALSLRAPPPAPRVAHYLIVQTQLGYKIKGFIKEFSSLSALITHHSVMPELLPVPLILPHPWLSSAKRKSKYGSRDYNHDYNESRDTFEMYDSLNDFRKMMSDLNV